MTRSISAALSCIAMPLLMPACAPAAGSPPAAVIADPPRDAENPAANRQLLIPSGPALPSLGRPAEMNALFFLASGEHGKPTMILLHGLPGNERNLDLAQAVRRAGWNVLTFTYRGAWGSEGRFSIANAVEDTAAALAFVRTPENAERHKVDSNRIVLAGHSMGGLAAALTAAADAQTSARHSAALAGLILIDAWNGGASARQVRGGGVEARRRFIEGFDDLGHALGPVTAADLADELIASGDRWDLRALAPSLARLPVLSVYASDGIREENIALADAIRRVPDSTIATRELNSDHSFADHRIALAAELVRWLEKTVPSSAQRPR